MSTFAIQVRDRVLWKFQTQYHRSIVQMTGLLWAYAACTMRSLNRISVERTTSIFNVTQFGSGGYWTFRDHDRLDAKAVNIVANKSYKNGKRYTSCTEMLAVEILKHPPERNFVCVLHVPLNKPKSRTRHRSVRGKSVTFCKANT
jgi:hypothetical protein